jgi:hypothetical protein
MEDGVPGGKLIGNPGVGRRDFSGKSRSGSGITASGFDSLKRVEIRHREEKHGIEEQNRLVSRYPTRPPPFSRVGTQLFREYVSVACRSEHKTCRTGIEAGE